MGIKEVIFFAKNFLRHQFTEHLIGGIVGRVLNHIESVIDQLLLESYSEDVELLSDSRHLARPRVAQSDPGAMAGNTPAGIPVRPQSSTRPPSPRRSFDHHPDFPARRPSRHAETDADIS